MKITINQDELEVAVRDYVAKMGLTLPVGNIDFTAARSQGNQIVTEIELSEREVPVDSTPVLRKPELAAVVPETKAAKPTSTKAEAPKEEPVVEKEEAVSEEAATPTGTSLFS